MKSLTFICPPMPANQEAAARRSGRLDHRTGAITVTREWFYDNLARHVADIGREPFTTPPRQKDVITWYSIRSYETYQLGAMRRIWSVNSNRVSPRCWRWLTNGWPPSIETGDTP